MRKVLITGGTRGIGKALVQTFLHSGDRVLFIYKNSENIAKELENEGAVGYRCDLERKEQIFEVSKKILSDEGTIDVLINNAGVASFSLFTDITDEEWQRVRAVNYDAPFYVTRAFLPGMISKKCGRIINISSMWGQVGSSCESAYSAAKAGIIGLTKALAKETGPSGITVNCVCPGVIDTDMNSCLSEQTLRELCEETPAGRLGTPEEVASLCLWLASPAAAFVTGQTIGVNGGFVIT